MPSNENSKSRKKFRRTRKNAAANRVSQPSQGTPAASAPLLAATFDQQQQQQQQQQPAPLPMPQQQQQLNDTVSKEYQLLLDPLFSAMTRVTDHLFLTGVGGMTHENFRKNHIDFVVNITNEAPFWEDVESMRLPLEDDVSVNILPHLDTAVDRIQEAISRRNAHVLVHCVAGVSRSATVVIAYLMKYRRMDLKSAFNYCYNLRPVIRPNNGFMQQLMNYELRLFGKNSAYMINVEIEDTQITLPHFFLDQHPNLVTLEVMRVRSQSKANSTTVINKTTTDESGA